MDKECVLTHILRSEGSSTLVGGELPTSVINHNRYVSPLTVTAEAVDQAICTTLTAGRKRVVLVGPAGSGKTTSLQKVVVDWARGDRLQNYSSVFHFRLREMNSLEGVFSLGTMLQHHGHVLQESVPRVLQRPEDVLFVFDDLDRYQHNLDPSAHRLCSDPSQPASAPCLLSSLLHGSLLGGAAFLVATRPTARLEFLRASRVEVTGFLKPQREAYFKSFFTDQSVATEALTHMDRTLGFYDFCSSPRFCWTVCSTYKSLMGTGAKLPETLSQLHVEILVQLIQTCSLKRADVRELVLALGKMASHCFMAQHPSCSKEETRSFGFQRFPASSLGDYLQIDGDLDSHTCVLSFHSQLMQEFILAVSVLLSPAEGVVETLEKHEDRAEFLDLFLSALSEPAQRSALETPLGEFDPDQILDFKGWFKSSSEETLKGCYKDKHHRCFRLLHQAQSESLVKEVIAASARVGISYGGLSLRDCVALNYVVSCLGEMEQLNLYRTRDLTEDKAEVLAPAMSLSRKIILSDSSLTTGAVPHLAAALRRGITQELDVSHTRLGDEKFKVLCAGLRDCSLQTLKLMSCRLTEASCEDLASVLASATSQLTAMEMMFNDIGDQGFAKLCPALRSPHCKLQELQSQSCQLTAPSMEALSAALCSGQSQLREVNLTQNKIGDSGVAALCKSLQHPLCRLQSINLFDSELTGACCAHLKEALMSQHCCLLELDLSVNDLGQEGALMLCQALRRPGCPVNTLRLKRCELTHLVFKELGTLLRSGTSPLASLSVGMNRVGDQGVRHLLEAVSSPGCLLQELDLEMTDLTDACVEDLCGAVRASRTLRSLELRNNSLTDESVPALVRVVQDSLSMQEMNLKYNDFSEEVFNMLYECDKIRF